MLKEWQFNVLFFVGVGGVLFLIIGPEFGLRIGSNPTAVTGLGAILTYILTQRSSLTRHKPEDKPKEENEAEDEEANDEHQ